MSEPLHRLYLLGPFDLGRKPGHTAGSPPVAAASAQQPRRKTRALLAYLAAAAPQAVPRETLAALFFPQSDDPLGALRWQLSELRRRLGAAVIVAQRNVVRLDQHLCWVDVREFDQILSRGAAA